MRWNANISINSFEFIEPAGHDVPIAFSSCQYSYDQHTGRGIVWEDLVLSDRSLAIV